jgi:hypothetical protein
MSQNDLNIDNKLNDTKELKTKSYVLRAMKNYYHNRKEKDPEYLEKKRDHSAKYYESHKEEIKQKRAKKRLEIKAKKELEKKNINTEQIKTDLEKVTINS